ncbi:MAG: hypothetical protein WCP79_12240 [Bacillota bacterium]
MMNKQFDCVEMKNQIQEKIYEEIIDMTLEQQLVYYQAAAQIGEFSYLFESRETDSKKRVVA